ncbi:hypothetical protein L3V77_18960 [Vibrio sp. DW001]|uniref:hypothetical protein n=1 Tax=Vibrio sp. DW001 TaxID=2912315 RepID=UPI0023B026C2|nr:hypothetical protein [Vibrio sp. DW001]WED29504.1 hypothetical protein L3V77_18960 [Vibrio sp. DW001]
MNKWLLLLVLSFNASATCQVDDTGVSNVIVNDMLGFISKKDSIMTRVLKKEGYKDYAEYALNNSYSDVLKQLTLLNEDDKEVLEDVHLSQSLDDLKKVIRSCTEKDLKNQLQFLMDDHYAQYREAMQGKNKRVEESLSLILKDINNN